LDKTTEIITVIPAIFAQFLSKFLKIMNKQTLNNTAPVYLLTPLEHRSKSTALVMQRTVDSVQQTGIG